MSNCTYNENCVDSVRFKNDFQVSLLSTNNENGLLLDILPSDENRVVNDSIINDSVHVITDLPLSENLSNINSPSSSCDLDSVDDQNSTYKKLNKIRIRNINKIIIAELNINSIRNKFEQLVEYINKNVDIILIVETKLDASFPTNQFHIEGYQQFRADRNSNGGGLLLYVNSNIPAKQIEANVILFDVETINIEINLWKRKWFICGSYNPQGSKIGHHLCELGKLIDSITSKYENIILLGDFNCTESDPQMENFLYTYNLKNLVKKTTCYKNVNNPSTIDLILTNKHVFSKMMLWKLVYLIFTK